MGRGKDSTTYISPILLLYVVFHDRCEATQLGQHDVLQSGVQLNFLDSGHSTIDKGKLEERALFYNKRFYLEVLVQSLDPQLDYLWPDHVQNPDDGDSRLCSRRPQG